MDTDGRCFPNPAARLLHETPMRPPPAERWTEIRIGELLGEVKERERTDPRVPKMLEGVSSCALQDCPESRRINSSKD